MSRASGTAEPHAALERVFREEAGRLTASLVRLLGNFDLAQELVSEAMVEALEYRPRSGWLARLPTVRLDAPEKRRN